MRLQFVTSYAFVRSVDSLHSVALLLAPSFDGIFSLLVETLPLFNRRHRFLRLQSMASGDFGRIVDALQSAAPLLSPSRHDTFFSV